MTRMPRSFRPAPRRAQRGVGMIEVLVAVLVLAIGLLGIAAMQAAALRNSQSSFERSTATVLVYSILDAMRANANVARVGGYNMALTCNVPAGGDLAANDRAAWMTRVQQNLNDTACGQIQCAADQCTVTIRWDDTRGTGGTATQTFATTTRI